MDLTCDRADTAHIVRVHGPRIDAPHAIRFKEDMRTLTRGLEGRVILDLREVEFIDSSGLGAVVAVMKQLDEGQKLELAALSPVVEKVFRLTRMDTIFAIHDDADRAGARACS